MVQETSLLDSTPGFYSEDQELFRQAVKDFINNEILPELDQWTSQRAIPAGFWKKAAENFLVGLAIEEEYGGMGLKEYHYRIIIDQELARHHLWSLALALHLQDDLALPVLEVAASVEQKKKIYPEIVSGNTLISTAMSEPDAGSDLRGLKTHAQRNQDHTTNTYEWNITGQKTFIGAFESANHVLVLAKTSEDKKDRDSTSLSYFFLPYDDTILKGEKLKKMGFWFSDTGQLFFEQTPAQSDDLVGRCGQGLEIAEKAMIQSRLGIATLAYVMAAQSIDDVRSYATERKLFENTLDSFQNTHFEVAEMTAQLSAIRALLEQTVEKFNAKKVTSAEMAAMKLFSTQTAFNIIDRCVQLFGGMGYIVDTPIAQTFLSARLLPIFGGSNEVMKTMIAKDIGFKPTRNQSH